MLNLDPGAGRNHDLTPRALIAGMQIGVKPMTSNFNSGSVIGQVLLGGVSPKETNVHERRVDKSRCVDGDETAIPRHLLEEDAQCTIL